MQTLLKDIWIEISIFFDKIAEIAPLLIIALIVSLLYFWISKIFRKRITRYLANKAEDPLQVNFLSDIFKILNGIIGTIIFLYIIGKQGVITRILGAGAISAFVIGFAFKDIGENFLAGIILAFKRPFGIGDTVMIQNIEGSIRDLNLRETHIKTFDGKDVYIPNGIILKNPLFNYTIDGFIRQQFTLGFDYGTDLDLARKLLLETVNQVPGVIQEDRIAKTSIGEAGLYKIFVTTQYWINPESKVYSGSEIKSEAIKNALLVLEQHGIKITSHQINLSNETSDE